MTIDLDKMAERDDRAPAERPTTVVAIPSFAAGAKEFAASACLGRIHLLPGLGLDRFTPAAIRE